MGDATVLSGPDVVVQATHEPVPTSETPAGKAAAARSVRAEKIAAAVAARRASSTTESDAGAIAQEPPVTPVAVAPAPDATADEPPQVDDATKRGLDAIEKRDKRAREQLATLKAEIEKERAELEKARAALPKIDDLKKLPVRDRYREALRVAGIDPDDEEHMELVARDSYARSKSGKSDPKNKQYAEQVAERNTLQSELAELRKMVEETRSTLSERDQKAQAEAFQRQYLDEAVKAVPQAPSLVGRRGAKNPARARAEMLSIGQRIEHETGETPTHAEVIAQYEKLLRNELEDLGFSEAEIAAKLAPPKPATTAPPAAKPARTLDPGAGSATPTIHGQPTRAQKLAAAREGLRKLRAEG